MRESQVIVDVINKQLRDIYGSDVVTGLSIFRVIWSDDQLEKRFGTYDDYLPGTKIYLRTVTEVREVPKYRQWIHQKHILERLVVVPEFQQHELPASKISYEPLWVFQDRNDNYLPPRLDAAKFIIDAILATQATATMMITGTEQRNRPSLLRYKDPAAGKSNEELVAHKNAKIDGLVETLFGDESSLMGTTMSRAQGGGSSIIVPHTVKE